MDGWPSASDQRTAHMQPEYAWCRDTVHAELVHLADVRQRGLVMRGRPWTPAVDDRPAFTDEGESGHTVRCTNCMVWFDSQGAGRAASATSVADSSAQTLAAGIGPPANPGGEADIVPTLGRKADVKAFSPKFPRPRAADTAHTGDFHGGAAYAPAFGRPLGVRPDAGTNQHHEVSFDGHQSMPHWQSGPHDQDDSSRAQAP
ncbi:hypothetical protein GCM10029964_092360 [Kibdelosporangium lantanae]